jgi:hypothetical protein
MISQKLEYIINMDIHLYQYKKQHMSLYQSI